MGIDFWLIAILAVVLIGFSKAGFGGGPGVLATPILAAVCGPTKAIAIMLPIMIFCDLCCVFIFRKGRVWKKVFNLLGGFFVGLLIATFFLKELPGQEVWLKKAIGSLAIVFGASYFFLFKDNRIEKYVPQKTWFGLALGVLAGIVSTLAHAAGPLTTMYFLSQGQRKENFMGSIVVYAFIGNCLKLPSYFFSGILTRETLSFSLPLLLAAVFGIGLGWYLNRRLSDMKFKGAVNGILVAIGLYLVAF
ncbi:MAG: sulfite exporter TauE/SafE family protein [Patescibacteria group bacterium]|nr:sulfite exporter TauE/SafE family protein [Patescibacteria group bacterium]MDD5294897.1 sulfite exporter TauE/SafE family protein [Patescibacteria group bacterium]MDD5554057.1 sulfite exporter TauE/SafE family protein [Patescibacteria group bacterium]